ncbi:MAG: hypothetical protein ABSB78_08045 [Bacteroidota bacterium]
MKINHPLFLTILLIPLFVTNTFSQSATHLLTFLPDTIGEFVVSKKVADEKEQTKLHINNDTLFARVQRCYDSPKGLRVFLAIIHGSGVSYTIERTFSKDGTAIKILNYDAIVWQDKNFSNCVGGSVKVRDNMMATAIVMGTTDKKYPKSILGKLDLKRLSVANQVLKLTE